MENLFKIKPKTDVSISLCAKIIQLYSQIYSTFSTMTKALLEQITEGPSLQLNRYTNHATAFSFLAIKIE